MKVKFYCDSGANIHSCRESDWLDVEEDLLFGYGEWEKLTDDEKYEIAVDWANNYLDIGYEEKNNE